MKFAKYMPQKNKSKKKRFNKIKSFYLKLPKAIKWLILETIIILMCFIIYAFLILSFLRR